MGSVTTVDDKGKNLWLWKQLDMNSKSKWYKVANFHCFKGAKQETAALDKEIKNCCRASSQMPGWILRIKFLALPLFAVLSCNGTRMNVKLKILWIFASSKKGLCFNCSHRKCKIYRGSGHWNKLFKALATKKYN